SGRGCFALELSPAPPVPPRMLEARRRNAGPRAPLARSEPGVQIVRSRSRRRSRAALRSATQSDPAGMTPAREATGSLQIEVVAHLREEDVVGVRIHQPMEGWAELEVAGVLE